MLCSGKITLDIQLDYENLTDYTLYVSASAENITEMILVNVTVRDVNEGPVITSDLSKVFYLYENETGGRDLWNITAYDPENATLTYSCSYSYLDLSIACSHSGGVYIMFTLRVVYKVSVA